MKRCPSCGEWNDDDAQRCWQCREVFDEITALRDRILVEPAAEKKGKKGAVKWQISPGEIWEENKMSIIMTIIFIALIFYAIVHKPAENKIASEATDITTEDVAPPAAGTNPVLSASERQSAATSESAAINSAYELFKKALEICPGPKCANPQKAIEYLDQAIKIKPNFAGAYNNRGNAYCDLGQYQRALEDFNEAIRIKPDYALSYGNRGVVYGNLGQNKRALEDYNNAIRLDPNFANAFVNRGAAYLSSGNKELGCADAQKACNLGFCQTLDAAKKKGECP
ncbi:MAG TPA: tetratricopeptide repeat protein [Smithella sp.]|nr:tetratricopeptide repeat protein [Smithella sp.]